MNVVEVHRKFGSKYDFGIKQMRSYTHATKARTFRHNYGLERMKFVLIPYESVGSIRFGMPRSEVRKILKTSVTELSHPFLPNGISSEEVNFEDSFDALDIQVAYEPKSPYLCVAVTLYEPATLIFRERDLLSASIEDLENWLTLIDNSTELIENQGVIKLNRK